MDRLDCQFMMMAYTWVHLTTFIIPAVTDLDRATGLIENMPEEDRAVLRQMLSSQ